jgi:polysaccharide biosynthesis/export protein
MKWKISSPSSGLSARFMRFNPFDYAQGPERFVSKDFRQREAYHSMNFIQQHLRKGAFVLAVMLAASQTGYAQNGLTQDRSDSNLVPVNTMSNTQSGNAPAGQLTYSTNYDTQFAPTSSFMQSPYGNGNGMMPQAGPRNPATNSAQDPYLASEVSPFSHYSPYLEVVGEGSDYSLGVDDVVTIIVRDQPDFSGRYVVDPDGNIQYNFVGDIKAEGKTKEQLKAEITEKLRRFVRYPEVAVMISEYRSKAVYVLGYVNSPGKYAMKGDRITVKEAVVAAGLPRMDAKTNKVYVIRPSQHTADGKPQKKNVNVNKLLNKGESAEDFILQPGDTVVVNQRWFDKFVNNFSRIIGPVFQSAAVYELGFGARDGGIFTDAK